MATSSQYRIDPRVRSRNGYHAKPHLNFVVVGAGGTGGFLVPSLARLLVNSSYRLTIVDMDVVEEHNTLRQNFTKKDIGRYKAQVLAERVARDFGVEVGYTTTPWSDSSDCRMLAKGITDVYGTEGPVASFVIGCVDNAAARRAINETIALSQGTTWWVDCGNGKNSGQVLVGNCTQNSQLQRAFNVDRGTCTMLPAPSLQRPDLLESPPQSSTPEPRLDCAERVVRGDQGPTINQVVASIAVTVIDKLLHDQCTWMGVYFDLEDGTMKTIPAEPKLVARMSDIHVNQIAPPNPSGRKSKKLVEVLTPVTVSEVVNPDQPVEPIAA